jgi:hypothetical protein
MRQQYIVYVPEIASGKEPVTNGAAMRPRIKDIAASRIFRTTKSGQC